MSAVNPTHIIADSIRGEIINADAIAAHVVLKLTDAGYSIVPSVNVEFGLATDDSPTIRKDVEEQAAYRIAARYPNAHVVSRVRGPWTPAAAEGKA